MRAGKKNRRIKIEQLAYVKTATGTKVEVWSLYRTVWAEEKTKSSTENFGGDQYTTQVGTVFKIDYIDGITPKDFRVIYRGREYNIIGVIELGMNEALELHAEAQY